MYKDELKKGISKDEQEQKITADRVKILSKPMKEGIEHYKKENKGMTPDLVMVFRDGVGGPTMENKLIEHELEPIKEVI